MAAFATWYPEHRHSESGCTPANVHYGRRRSARAAATLDTLRFPSQFPPTPPRAKTAERVTINDPQNAGESPSKTRLDASH